jgi:hypothetical protein
MFSICALKHEKEMKGNENRGREWEEKSLRASNVSLLKSFLHNLTLFVCAKMLNWKIWHFVNVWFNGGWWGLWIYCKIYMPRCRTEQKSLYPRMKS